MASPEDSGFGTKEKIVPGRMKVKTSLSEEDVEHVISKVILRYKDVEGDERHTNLLIDGYRYLRNLVGNPETSSRSLEPLIEQASDLCEIVDRYVYMDRDKAESTVALCRISLQLLGNLVSREETASTYRTIIWRNGSAATFMEDLLKDRDKKIRTYGSMIFYNCLADPDIFNFIRKCSDLVELIFMKAFLEPVDENPWALFMAQALLADETFLDDMWKEFGDERCQVYIALVANIGLLEKAENDSTSASQIHNNNVSFLASAFVNECDRLTKLEWPVLDEREFELSAALLELLCTVASFDNIYPSIRDDQRILDAALTQLKMTAKQLGSAKEEMDKMAAMLQGPPGDPDFDESWFVNGHPLNNYRSRIVRLLANVCYKHPANQQLMRERDGITLILNSTPLDAENNFIREWSIFALRNLLEQCPENQEIVKELKALGFTKK